MEKQQLEWQVSTDSIPSRFRTHIGTVASARRTAVKHAKEVFAEPKGATVTIRDALSREVVERFRL